MWWVLHTRYALDSTLDKRYVKVDSKWDLMAYIGYLYSTSFVSIDRIDYQQCKEEDVDPNLVFDANHIHMLEYKQRKD